jgi:hypothetical protein
MMNLKRSRIIYCALKLTPAACVPSAAVTGIVARKFRTAPGRQPSTSYVQISEFPHQEVLRVSHTPSAVSPALRDRSV